jgi:hypothetical protein
MMSALALMRKFDPWKTRSRKPLRSKLIIYIRDAERREKENKQHEEYVATYREKNFKSKEDIKNKLSSNFKN